MQACLLIYAGSKTEKSDRRVFLGREAAAAEDQTAGEAVDPGSADLSLVDGILFFTAFVVSHLYLHINNMQTHTGTFHWPASLCMRMCSLNLTKCV